MGWYIIIRLSRIRPRKIRQLKEHDDAVSPQVHICLPSLADIPPACKRPRYYELDHGACPSVVPPCRALDQRHPGIHAACPVLCHRVRPAWTDAFCRLQAVPFRCLHILGCQGRTCRSICSTPAGSDPPPLSHDSHELSRRSRRQFPLESPGRAELNKRPARIRQSCGQSHGALQPFLQSAACFLRRGEHFQASAFV